MRLAYEIPDESQRVLVGERGALPGCFVARQPAEADRPEITLTVEVRDGRVGCSCVAIETAADSAPLLSATELRALRLPHLLEKAIRDNLWEQTEDGNGWWVDPARDVVDQVVRSTHRRRNRIDQDHLDAVANAYSRAGVGGVRESLGKSRSQAYRLIARARQAGLLNNSTAPVP